MARKANRLNFKQMVEALRGHGFEVSETAGAQGGVQVSKNGVAAVLLPQESDPKWESGGARLAVTPGIVVRGEISRLLDRGYQKFIKTGQYELPATAQQLQAIHVFTEELNQVTKSLGLYNESLGTTSDVYQYDRLLGREAPEPKAKRPWELAGGH
jgi:hypothetical protein